MTSEADIQRLALRLGELDAQRARFHELAAELEARGGVEGAVTGDWNLRDLMAHVAFWDHHAADALELVVSGRGAAFDYDAADTDRMNADNAVEAGRMDLDAARAWEDREFFGFRSRVAGLDPLLLDVRLGNGDTLDAVIRYDGPEHYAEHAGHIEDALRDRAG